MYGTCEYYGTEQCDTCIYFGICYAEFNDIEELEEE
jgi:hypothetical protein